MAGILKQAAAKLREQKLDWALANFTDRPLWSSPYFLFGIAASALARRKRYARWYARRGEVTDTSRKVSVVMTTYNTGRFVEKAVSSILNQSYPNLELIVVDDASSDDTFDILQALQKSDSRMSAYRLSRNSGTYFAKNVGRLISRGCYFATHDSDDTCHPDWLRFHVSAHESFPEIVASQNHYVRVDETGKVVLNRGSESRTALMSMVYNHRAIANSVGFFDSVRMAADREYSDRIILSLGKDRILRFDDRHYFALVREGQLTAESKVVLAATGNNDSDYMSPERLEYIRASATWYGTRHPLDVRMAFPLKERPFGVPERFHPHRSAEGVPEFTGDKVEVTGPLWTRTVAELAEAYDREFVNG